MSAALKPNQTAIYYIAGDEIERLKASPHLEGFRARGVEVLLLPDPVDTFWVMSGVSFEGKPLKSVTQGAADLALIPRLEAAEAPPPHIAETVKQFLAFLKNTLGDEVAEVRASDRLTDSAVCLVAAEFRSRPGIGEDPGRCRAAHLGVEADPRGQSAPQARDSAGGARSGGAGLQGGRRASAVRRGAAPRRRPSERRQAVFRAAGARARTRRAVAIGLIPLWGMQNQKGHDLCRDHALIVFWRLAYSAGVRSTAVSAAGGVSCGANDGSIGGFVPLMRK